MKTQAYLLSLLAVAATVLAACGSEDTPAISYDNPSLLFQPSDSDQSSTAALRRRFFGETGSYLLFNDTLQRVYQGTDITGQPRYFTETIDLAYDIGSSSNSSSVYSFTYLTTEKEQTEMAQFVKDYILPHATKRLKPYSFFLCNRISVTTSNKVTTTPYAVANERCVAVAANYLLQRPRTEAQKKNFAGRVLNTLVAQAAKNNTNAFRAFYAHSANYYNRTYTSAGIKGSADELAQLGFISSGGTPGSFPSQDSDLSAFITSAILYDDAWLANTYGRYSVVMAKFAIVRQVLAALGYVA